MNEIAQMTIPNIQFSSHCYAVLFVVLNTLAQFQQVYCGENEVHRPMVTALRWAKVGTGAISIAPGFLNGEYRIAVAENGPDDFRTSVWMLGTTDAPAKMLHRSLALGSYFPIQDGRQVLLLCDRDLIVWDFERNRMQIVGAINPSEVLNQPPVRGAFMYVCANDKTRIIAYSDFVNSVRLISYDSIGTGRTSRFSGGQVFIMPDGNKLITISDDAVRVHPIDVGNLIVQEPVFTFRELREMQTNEIAHGINPLELPKEFPASRGRVFWKSCVTFDGNLAYVRIGAEFEKPRGGGPAPVELMGYETWVVTDDNRSRIVRFDEPRDSRLGYAVTTLGVPSSVGKYAKPYFLSVYQRELAVLPLAFDKFQTGIPEDCIFKVPESIDGIREIAAIESAALNADGSQLLTGHADGHVILWKYDY